MIERPFVRNMVADTFLPRMFKVRQTFPRTRVNIEDIPNIVDNLLSPQSFAGKILPGMRIGITASSRGIANQALIIKSIVTFVKNMKAHPFVIPAMGSHGGATAEGQREVLAQYGITEDYVGCPIVSSMEVTKIGVNQEGMDVFIDKHAAEADGIIVNCRIKPHTAFRGPYESGIMKMMAIGLGKQYGAEVIHEAGFKNMAKFVPMFGRVVLHNAPILFAVASIENAYDETAEIIAVNSEEIEEMEPLLLKRAFSNMPRILVDACDVLIVDQIGKNFSGDGMDPNITGTFCSPYATGGIQAQRVCVLDLSPETHGNGIGLGYSSATTKRVFNQLDFASMYPNAITCTVLGGVRIPIVMESDRDAIKVCVRTCNEINKSAPRIVRIPNSLHIEHIQLSESYLEEARLNPQITVESKPEPFPFDENGNLW